MAKFRTTIIAVALSCLFALSIAGTQPENDESTTQVSLPISDAANPALRLSSEPANTEEDSNSAAVSSVPLTKITFRPVNRRFPMRSKRPCRHHFRFYPTVRGNEEIPYGNDMIVSSGENSDFQEPIFHGEGRRIPLRWLRLRHHHHHHHHHHDEDSDSDDEDDDRAKKIVFKKYDYDRFDREKKLKKLRKHFRVYQNDEVVKKKKGGFMNSVRKFLDHYF